MKALIVVIGLCISIPGMARFGVVGNKQAGVAVVKKALENPGAYRFDDGGNINFGHGFYTRRIKFNGRPNVCHANNFLYAGVRQKCVKKQKDEDGGDCLKYKEVQLKTQMSGKAQVCTDHSGDDGDGPCTKYSTVKFNKGPKVKVALYKKNQMDKDRPMAGFLGFTYLTIPGC